MSKEARERKKGQKGLAYLPPCCLAALRTYLLDRSYISTSPIQSFNPSIQKFNSVQLNTIQFNSSQVNPIQFKSNSIQYKIQIQKMENSIMTI